MAIYNGTTGNDRGLFSPYGHTDAADTYVATDGFDVMQGGYGNDVFLFDEQSDVELSFGGSEPEIIGGGIDGFALPGEDWGYDTIRSRGTIDFRFASIWEIDRLLFFNDPAGGSQQVTFNSSQFGFDGVRFQINESANFDANLAGANRVEIFLDNASLDASQFTFTDWEVGDVFRIRGRATNDTVTLSSVADTVTMQLGNDIIRNIGTGDYVEGNEGSDRFVIQSGNIAATLDGGALDTFDDVLEIGGLTDLRTSTLRNFEQVDFSDAIGNSQVTLNASQFGGTGLSTALRLVGGTGINTLIVNTSAAAQNFNASGFTAAVNFTGSDRTLQINGTDANNTLVGSITRDVINGFGGNDRIRNVGSGDVINGGTEGDVIDVTSNVALAATIDGGLQNDQLYASGSVGLSGSTLLSIEQLRLHDTINTDVRFAASQFGDGLMSNTLAILTTANSTASNKITVSAGATPTTFSAAGWTFTSFNDATDVIAINGGVAGDTLTGSIKKDVISGNAGTDIITGGLGADTLSGGTQADSFVYNSTAEAAAGETCDGGDGTDTVFANGDPTQDIDLRGVNFISIENMQVSTAGENAPHRLFLDSSQFGTGGLASDLLISPSSGTGEIALTVSNTTGVLINDFNALRANTVNGFTMDYVGSDSTETFVASASTNIGQLNVFANGGDDVIDLNLAHNFVSVDAGAGIDQVFGGAADETFVWKGLGFAQTGEIWEGAGGHDKIEITGSGAVADFSGVSLSSIEELTLSSVSARFSASQFGAGLSSALRLSTATTPAVELQINLGSVADFDASAFVFDGSWQIAGISDMIRLIGSAAANTIVGSSKQDIIIGGGGKDTMTGGEGADFFRFNALTDSLIGPGRDRITDFVSGQDKIDLRAIDANIATPENDAFSVLAAGQAIAAGTVRIRQGATQQVIDVYVDGDTIVDMQFNVDGNGKVTGAADFLL